jgi:hypothetical protein
MVSPHLHIQKEEGGGTQHVVGYFWVICTGSGRGKKSKPEHVWTSLISQYGKVLGTGPTLYLSSFILK